MEKAKKATDHLTVAALLVRYNCPIPYHAVHTRFMGTGIQKLKVHAKHLKAQHPDAAASLLEGLEELFTINRLGVT